MKSRSVLQVGEHSGWEIIFDYGAPQNFVNGLTTLFSFTAYGDEYSSLVLIAEGQDGVNTMRPVLDVSHGGSRKISSAQKYDDPDAGDEGVAIIEYSNPFTYARGQVVNTSGSTVVGRWALLGKRRS